MRLPPLDVRARWSIAMIARAMGEKRGAAYRAMRSHGVPIHQDGFGKKRWVNLIDLQRAWPDGWLGMLRASELRKQLNSDKQ